MKWRKHSAVELSLSALKTRTEIEREFWEEYALALIFPRFLPEWMPDETISNALWRTVATERLPWEIDEEWFEQVSHGHDTND